MSVRSEGTLRPILTLLAVVGLGACVSPGGGAPTVFDLAGTWEGMLDIEGERLPLTMQMTQTGLDLSAFVTTPIATAELRGKLEAMTIDLRGEYEVTCPGTVRLNGEIFDAGRRIEGTVRATDCTGMAVGSFGVRWIEAGDGRGRREAGPIRPLPR